MAERLVSVITDNIVSPLGLSTEENLAAVLAGKSAIRKQEDLWDLPEAFAASMFDQNKLIQTCDEEGIDRTLTLFERLVLLSVKLALVQTDIDITSRRVLFILSSTKGNIDLLRENPDALPPERVFLGETARIIARHLGNPNSPLVVSNACISGAAAQITAMRLLQSGLYDAAVICGADLLSPFIVSGFQSLKALSEAPCRPFDEERMGINLGDAAATIVLKADTSMYPKGWILHKGAIRNDAFHITNPSRTAEGCCRALQQVTEGLLSEDIAFINAHGTATLFNDEMEAVAIHRAGFQNVPTNSLKGYFGHTLGAAGIVETIISMHTADKGIVLGTKGFDALGTSRPIQVQATHSKMREANTFVKLMSGFGGCNAAMLFKKENP